MRSRSGGELPQLELDCLAVLWRLERAPVADVHAQLAERGRPLAYTTVLTVLERLLRKQVVARQRQGRAYVYAPLVTRAQMRERAVERLIGNYFDSRQELAHFLAPGTDAITSAPRATTAHAAFVPDAAAESAESEDESAPLLD